MSEVSEAEVREWLEEEEQGAGGKEPGAADRQPVLTHAGLHGVRRRGVGGFIYLLFPWCASLRFGTGLGGGQRGSLQRAATARTADRKRTVHNLAMI